MKRLSPVTLRGSRAVCCALCLLIAHAAARADAEVLLVESFESMDGLETSGEVQRVTISPAVTHGSAALRLSPGASVRVVLPIEAVRRLEWVRFDTHHVAEAAVVQLAFRRLPRVVQRTAHVLPGRDTVAVPLSIVHAAQIEGWPSGNIELEIRNPGPGEVSLDNVRLESAAPAPPGAVLLDFGPDRQSVWPGFQPAGLTNRHVVWSGRAPVYGAGVSWPDPLTCDWVGRPLSANVTDHFTLHGTGPAGLAWLWFTHYGDRAYNQPSEWSVRVSGRQVAGRRLMGRTAIGPDCLLEGLGGDWTAEWFDTRFARHFVELVQVPLPAASPSRVEIHNAQLAAVAIAPVEARREMGEYMQTVQADLSRYRRQFVVARRLPARVAVPEDTPGVRQAAMVFRAPLDQALAPGWVPDETDRIESLRVLVANGDTAVVPLAIVPTRANPFLSATLGTFRTEQGRTLRLEREGTGVHACQAVPRVREGYVTFQPWILDTRLSNLEAGEVGMLALVLRTHAGAEAGTYSSEIRVRMTHGQITIPVEVEVLDLGAVPPVPAWTVAGQGVEIGSLYGPVTGQLSEQERAALNNRIRQEMLSIGLGSLLISGPGVHPGGTVRDGGMTGNLRALPLNALTAPTVISVSPAFRDLGFQAVQPGTTRYDQGAAAAVRHVARLAGEARLPGYVLMTDTLRYAQHADSVGHQVTAIRRGGGEPGAVVHASALRQLDDAHRSRIYRPMNHLVLRVDAAEADGFADDFRSLGGARSVWISASRPGRLETGFIPAAAGAVGVAVEGLFLGTSPFRGVQFNGQGLLVPDPSGNFRRTVNVLRLWQGQSDWQLYQRVAVMAEEARRSGNAAAELDELLAEIRQAVFAGGVRYDGYTNQANINDAQLEEFRLRLLGAAANARSAQ